MLNLLKRLYRDEEAATAVEYAIIAAVIGIAAIVAFRTLGQSINDKMEDAAGQIQNNGR
jgi:pilus assembly protein Flp/PilA